MDFFDLIAVRWLRLRQEVSKASALVTGDYTKYFGAPVDEDIARQFRASQLDGVLWNTGGTVFANAFNVVVLLFTLWGNALRGPGVVWSLFVMLVVVLGARPLLKQRKNGLQMARGASAAAMQRCVRNAFILGSVWGLAPVLFFADASNDARFVLICICAGTLGGGAFALASVPAAAVGMIVPLIAGSIAAIFHDGGANAIVSSLLIFFYAVFLLRNVFNNTTSLLDRQGRRIELELLAKRDVLTELPNQAAFRAMLGSAAIRMKDGDEKYSVVLIDIDRMRDINHRLGYPAGDIALREIAARLRLHVRSNDLLARVDGDQFALLVRGLAGAATLEAYARRVAAAFAEPFSLPGGDVMVTASIGVATAEPEMDPRHDVLNDASMALTEAQGKGAGAMQIYNAIDKASGHSRNALERDLRTALEKDELRVHFQPFLDIGTGGISGFEALLRWRHPARGYISPPDIIAIAEERGLIDVLGAYVMNEACRVAALWPGHLRVAVNVSPLQLRSRTLSEVVATALQTSGLPAHRLEIEITENAVIADQALARHILLSLRTLGVKLALDDFGVGYSSLNYLWSLPFDKLKIDKSFIDEVVRNPDAAAIVRSILNLARDLRLTVTAEGIETEAQLEFLRRFECAEAQGYLIGRPMPELAIPDFLEAANHALAA